MKSLSKIDLDPEALAAFSWSTLGSALVASHEVSDGWFNTIHRLDLADGRSLALKLAPRGGFVAMRYERDLIRAEGEVMEFLGVQGHRVPRVHRKGGAEGGLPADWFVMDWVEGQTLASLRGAGRDLVVVDREVAVQTSEINQITGSQFGRWLDDQCSSPSWATSFSRMVDDLLADAADRSVDLAWSPERIRSVVTGARAELDAVKTPGLVLWDLHDANILAGGEPLALRAFIDPDRALWGDPLMEFCFRPLAKTPASWFAQYDASWAAAGRPSPRAIPGAERRLALYDLYLALVMVIEVAYRGFGPDHEAWVRANLKETLEALDR